MSFVKNIANKKSVPSYFYKAHKSGISEQELKELIKDEVELYTKSSAMGESVWSPSVVASMVESLYKIFMLSIKNI